MRLEPHLLCAGITTYSPPWHWKVGPGMTVGVVGIGGLGHLGLELARDGRARRRVHDVAGEGRGALALGAHEVVLSRDAKQIDAQARRFDFILDTIAVPYPMAPTLRALERSATLCTVGIPGRHEFSPIALTMGRRNLASSGVGGTVETEEMLAFCAPQGIVSDYEPVKPTQIAAAFERMDRGYVRYRSVLDMQG